MKKSTVIAALSALAQDTRLDVFRLLIQVGSQGLPAGEIGERLGLPGATLSFHLNTLKHAGLIRCRRESRSLIYSADFEAMNALLGYLMENCCAVPACLPDDDDSEDRWETHRMSEKIYNVLFLCTGNSARSQIAEAILNRIGKGRFRAYSAGSHPSGKVQPMAITLLKHFNFSTEGLRSKSWDEFASPEAPVMDFVFTVCDQAAGEVCPVWPGQPMTAHWGLDDPVAVEGSEVERMQAFRETFRVLENRIKIFTSLRLEALDRLKLKRQLDQIGRTGVPENNET